jgi:endo-beta-N-acetylglucosaminidase D
MRPISLMTTALILLLSDTSFAQNWTDYTSRTDLFHVNFPGEPKIKDITYATEYGITLPGHVYVVETGPSRYSVTVVDYSDAQKIHTARAEQCRKNGGEGDACQNDWRGEVQGAIVYASWQFFQRNAKVTHYAWYVTDLIEGHRLQLSNSDGSTTFAAIHRHGTRLYILEATVPKGAPAPGLFQQSLQFIDEEGKPVRYRTYYTTGYSEEWKFPAPLPPRAR